MEPTGAHDKKTLNGSRQKATDRCASTSDTKVITDRMTESQTSQPDFILPPSPTQASRGIITTALGSKCHGERHEATEEEDDQRTLNNDLERIMWTASLGLAARSQSRQHNTERGGDEWFVAYDTSDKA